MGRGRVFPTPVAYARSPSACTIHALICQWQQQLALLYGVVQAPPAEQRQAPASRSLDGQFWTEDEQSQGARWSALIPCGSKVNLAGITKGWTIPGILRLPTLSITNVATCGVKDRR